MDYEAWLWNRLYCPPEYNNINWVVKNEYDNRKEGNQKKSRGNICWIFYCQQGLHASHIKSVHLFMANANGKSFSCRKLAELTFFRAEKIHLSRVVSAVKDELRPPKEVIYWTPCYCCTNKVAQNGWKINLNIAHPFTLANKTFPMIFIHCELQFLFAIFQHNLILRKTLLVLRHFSLLFQTVFKGNFTVKIEDSLNLICQIIIVLASSGKKTCAMYAI